MADDKTHDTAGEHIDELTGTATTGHVWDGIRELNNPLPRWWVRTFYATIVWAIGYAIYYPAIPLVNSATSGISGYSSRAVLEDNLAAARAAQGERLSQIASLSLEDIRSNEELLRFAVAGGRSAFLVNCVQCHGSGAAGSAGFPNLNDDDWLWGGKLEDIHATLEHGIRFARDDDTRISEMPAFGADGLLDADQIASVAEHVLALSGQDHDAAKAEAGAEIYAEQCAACHGDDGGGIRDLGGPRLNDKIWLYGGTRQDIVAQVTKPQQGVMPAWGTRLDATTIKQLAVYVHSLGGGE